MSDKKTGAEDTSNKDGKKTGDTTSGSGDTFKAITSQDELNRVIDKRLERERAKFADYDELKSAKAKLDQIEEANKSEIDKANDAKAAAEKAAAEAKAEALRWKVAAKHGVSDEDAELFLTGTDEQTLTKQAERLADRKPSRSNTVRREGSTTKPEEDEMREFTRALFSGAQT